MQDEWVGRYGDLWGLWGNGDECRVSGCGAVAISKGCGRIGVSAG